MLNRFVEPFLFAKILSERLMGDHVIRIPFQQLLEIGHGFLVFPSHQEK